MSLAAQLFGRINLYLQRYSTPVVPVPALSSLFIPQSPTFYDIEKEAFENIVGKGENAGNQHFLLFPQCLLPFPKQIQVFQ